MSAYYNEIEPYAAAWLRNLIAAGHIAPGDVDERSIVDVRPDDLIGYTQCHFFAGIGGWSYAARLAGWPDDRPLWTGSCPCQPYSVAGKGEGQKDPRHLWPDFFRLIRARRPDVIMGEQVAAAVGKHWLDGVCADLEGDGYAVGAAVVPACAVDAPHRRDRLWFVADGNGGQPRSIGSAARKVRDLPEEQRQSEFGAALPDRGRALWGDDVENAESERLEGRAKSGEQEPASGERPLSAGSGELCHVDDRIGAGLEGHARHGNHRSGWSVEAGSASPSGGPVFAVGADGKARRVEPGIRLLAHGVPARVGKLRAYGNAIVPQVAAEIIGAYLDAGRLAA